MRNAPKDCPRRAELGTARDALLEPCCNCECLGDVEAVLDRMWAAEKEPGPWESDDARTVAQGRSPLDGDSADDATAKRARGAV